MKCMEKSLDKCKRLVTVDLANAELEDNNTTITKSDSEFDCFESKKGFGRRFYTLSKICWKVPIYKKHKKQD